MIGRICPRPTAGIAAGKEAGDDGGHLPVAGEAEGDPVHGQVPVGQGVEIDRRGRAGEAADVDHVPVYGGGRQALGEGPPGDVVEDDVDAVSVRRVQGRLGEVLLAGDDDDVRPGVG